MTQDNKIKINSLRVKKYNIDLMGCIGCECMENQNLQMKNKIEDEFKPLHTEGSDIKNNLHEMKCQIGRIFYYSDMSSEYFWNKFYCPLARCLYDSNKERMDSLTIDERSLELYTLIIEKLKKYVYGK